MIDALTTLLAILFTVAAIIAASGAVAFVVDHDERLSPGVRVLGCGAFAALAVGLYWAGALLW